MQRSGNAATVPAIAATAIGSPSSVTASGRLSAAAASSSERVQTGCQK